jgi:hypothetical protein
MSNEEHSEILDNLLALRNLVNWLGGGLVVGMCGVAWVIVTDHFDQRSLREDVEVIKPRVERLWYSYEISREAKKQ